MIQFTASHWASKEIVRGMTVGFSKFYRDQYVVMVTDRSLDGFRESFLAAVQQLGRSGRAGPDDAHEFIAKTRRMAIAAIKSNWKDVWKAEKPQLRLIMRRFFAILAEATYMVNMAQIETIL